MIRIKNLVRTVLTLSMCLLFSSQALAVPLLISISNPPGAVNATAVGDTQFWPQAGTLGPGGTPISLRATVQSISAGDSIRLFTSGDNPVVRANTGTLSATVLWEVFDRNTGLPIVGDPDFLITDIDGRNGNPIESVSAACAGLTSFTTNGDFLAGCNANSNNACDTNIRVSESGGSILAEGTQNQSGNQQEGYMQYSWTGVSDWTVTYIATSRGRWFVHDADGDIPFDGTRIPISLVDLATIKGLSPSSNATPQTGDQIEYQIDLSNAGPSDAANVNLTDPLPAGLTYVSHRFEGGGSGGAYNPSTGELSGVSVPVGETRSFFLVANVTAPAGATVTNTSTTALATESVCSSRDMLSFSFVVAQTPAPSLEIVKSIDPATSFSQAGDTITYRYVVSNTGNVTISGAVPTDTGPTFGGMTASNTLSAFNPVSATITPGNSQTFTATYLLSQADVDNMARDAAPLTAIDNTARATGTPPSGSVLPLVPPSTAETGFAPAPGLSITKSVSAATTFDGANDTITYEYVVSNTGNITVESVVPVDTGPTFNGVAGTNSLSTFNPASATIAPNTNAVFQATYVLSQTDVDNLAAAADPLMAIRNSATATGDPVGAAALPTVTNSVVTAGFAPAPSFTVAKSVSNATTFSQAGDTITYQYVIDNTGNVTINNAVPIDTGPTFNGVAGTNALSAFSPANASIAPSDAPVTFTATYVLSQEDVDRIAAASNPAQAISNTASARGVPTGGTLANAPNSNVTTGFTPTNGLTLTKTAGAPSVGQGTNTSASDAGDTIEYSFAVSNTGQTTVTSLQINDAGPTFNTQTGTGTLSAISCPLTTLAPNQNTTCTATYTLSQADVDNAIAGGANSIANSATASGLDPVNAAVTSAQSAATTSISAQSSIDLVKAAGAPTINLGTDATIVDPGDTIAFTVTVSNTGNTTLSSVMIDDPLISLNCPATTTAGNAFANNGSDTLAVGDSISCTATYPLLQTDLNNGGVTNTATVDAVDPTSAAVSDSETVNSGFTQKAAVALVKSNLALAAPPAAGEFVTYEFRLTNTGNVSLSAPQVADPQCENPASPLTRNNGYISGDAGINTELDAGETWLFQCQYELTLPDINTGDVANTATGTGTPPAGSGLTAPTSQASNLANVQQNAALEMVKTAALPTTAGGTNGSLTDVGDTISYTFDLENTGNVTLTNVVVTDPLINGQASNNTVVCPAGAASLDPGATLQCTATYTLTQTDINNGVRDNTASATGTPPVTVPPIDAPMTDSSSVANITRAPSLSVAKTADALPNPLQANSVITYRYTVTNTGNVTISGVSPADTGPTFNGVIGSNALSAFSPAPVNLLPGQQQVFTATYQVSQADLDNLVQATDQTTGIDNTATATGTPAGGTLAPVTPSTVETGVALNASINLVKTSTAPASVTVGQAIVYDFALNNDGQVSINNPVIDDAQCSTPTGLLSFTNGYQAGDAGVAGVLEPGETWTFSCSYAITQADIDAGTVQNTAQASGQTPSGATVNDVSDSGNAGDGTVGNTSDPTNTTLNRTASWNVAKSTTSTPTSAGDTLVYEFVVTNTGNTTISSVMISDAKCDGGISFVSGDDNANDRLEPSEIWRYQCTSIGVTQTEVNSGSVDNTVQVTGTPPTGAPALAPATNMISTPITANPSLTLAKSAAAPTIGLGVLPAFTDPGSATVSGDTITYTFDVTNNGNVTLTNVGITDPGPTFGSPAQAGTGTLSAISCAATTLAPQQATQCTATYELSQVDIDRAAQGGANSIANSATAQGTPPVGLAVNSASASATQSLVASPDTEIIKSAGAATVTGGSDPSLTDVGDTVTFTITVRNTGNVTLSNVVVSDSLVPTVSCPGPAMPSGAAYASGGNLAVGDMITCTAVYSLTQTDINNGQALNTATVAAQDPAGTGFTRVSEAIAPISLKASIALSKTSNQLPAAPVAGVSQLTYTFEVENTGNVSLSNVTLTDPLITGAPNNGSFTCVVGSAANPSLPTATPFNLTTDSLNGGATIFCTATYTVTQADINAGEVSNTANVVGTPPASSGLQAPTATAANRAEAQQTTGLTLDKASGAPTLTAGISQVGDTIPYTLTIQNAGNVTLNNVTITDPLITDAPNNGTFSCVRGDASTPSVPTATPFDLTVDSLNGGDTIFCTANYTLTQADIDNGSVANEAIVSGSPPVTVPPTGAPSGRSSNVAPIPSAPRLNITKVATAPSVNLGNDATLTDAGDTITYTFTVENTGNVTVREVLPSDSGPTFNGVPGTNALSAFSVDSSPSTPVPVIEPDAVTPNATAVLLPGQIQVFTATYELSQTDLDNMASAATPGAAIANTATAEGEPVIGPAPTVNDSPSTTGVTPAPEMVLIKTSALTQPATAGSLVTYTFTLENTGNVTISSPEVVDPLCQIPASPLTFNSGYVSGDTGTIAEALDVGETWTFSCQYALSQPNVDAGTVQNEADANGQDPAGGAVTDESDSGNVGDGTAAVENDPTNTAITRTPNWRVDKSTTSVPSALNDTLEYQFLVTNTGNVTITPTSIVDPKCASAPVLDATTDTGVSGELSPAGAGGSPAAEQWRYTCTSVGVIQDELDAGVAINTVTLNGTAPGGNPPQIDDEVRTPINTSPGLSLVKSAGVASLNADGTFDQIFNFALRNTGNVTLLNAEIIDNIPSQFGTCFDQIVLPGIVALSDVAPTSDSAVPVLGPNPPATRLASSTQLAVGDTVSLSNYVVRFNPNATGCSFPATPMNMATANAGTNTAGNVSDASDNGVDPAAGTPNGPGLPTPFAAPAYAPQLGLSKAAGTPTQNDDGTIDVAFTLLLENTGNVNISNVSLLDDLVAQYGSAFSASASSVVTGGIIVGPSVRLITDAAPTNIVLPTASTTFDGSSGSDMLTGSSLLGVGDRIEVTFTARINPYASGAPANLLNTATARGSDPAGTSTSDDSNNGADPTSNPGGPGAPTPVVPPALVPAIELTKSSTLNTNGTIDYEFVINNTGNINLNDVRLTDALLDPISLPATLDTDTDGDIDVVTRGDSVTVTVRYTITDTDLAAGQVINTASVSGTDPAGTVVNDDSDSGNPADDTGANDDDTVTTFTSPSLGVAKSLQAGSPVDLGNGTYQVTYEFVISNTGGFDLPNLQLDDDLNAMINNPNTNNATYSNPLVSSPNNTLTPNSSYDGNSVTGLLSGADTLLVGETGRVDLTFTFDPAVYFGPFLNQARVSADGLNGVRLEDLSEDGSTVNADTESPSPFQIATPSTPITLGWFHAQQQGSGVLFEWATEVEVSNAGFELLYMDDNQQWRLVSETIIPASGDSTDIQTYQYTVEGSDAKRFKLVDVSVTGNRIEHGPFNLGEFYGAKVPRKSTDWDAFDAESDSKRTERMRQRKENIQRQLQPYKPATNDVPRESSQYSASKSVWSRLAGVMLSVLVPSAHAMDVATFTVEQPGLYRVEHSDLMAQGIDLRGIELERLNIKQAKDAWPMMIDSSNLSTSFDESTALIFPGQGLSTLYTGVNKYTLVLDEGVPVRMQADDRPIPSNTAPASTYLAEASYAPQNRYTHLSPSRVDSWYADRLQAINGPASKRVMLQLDDYAPSLNRANNTSIARQPRLRPRLEVNLWGNSNLPGNGVIAPDHRVQLQMNGELLADARFDGLVEYPIRVIPSALQEGQNTVDISLPRNHGYRFDLINLDRVSIFYPRRLNVQDNGNALVFESQWSFFKLSELSDEDVTIVRVDNARQGYVMTQRYTGSCQQGCAYFAGDNDGQTHTYYVATAAGYKTPTIEVAQSFNDIFSDQAQYLIIAHPDFIDTPNRTLEVLADQLRERYQSVDIVSVDDIYQQYSGGVLDAYAISSYVQDAFDERDTRHLMLVGGDNYDYKNYLESNAQSFVPSIYVRIATNVNAVPSDAKYADVDGDNVPDLTVTRLPVRNTAELERLVNKRTDYLARSTSQRAIFAADKVDNSGYSFMADSQGAISDFFGGWQIETVYLDDLPLAAGRQSLLSALNQGASLVSYSGHSSTDRWAIAGLLTGDDVANLSNTNNPMVVTQWGCWNTFHVSPEQDSLAHRFLVETDAGAVTVMGASSFTKAEAERHMADLLFPRLQQGMTIGDAVLSAKRALAETSPYQLDVLLGWAVLGPDDFPVVAE